MQSIYVLTWKDLQDILRIMWKKNNVYSVQTTKILKFLLLTCVWRVNSGRIAKKLTAGLPVAGGQWGN